MGRPPRRLFYREYQRNTRTALNGTVENVAFNVSIDDFPGNRCDPDQTVYLVVKSQNCVIDWGIPLSDEADVDPNNNGVGNAADASTIYTNATAGFQRIRYVRTGVAGSAECFEIFAKDVHRLTAYLVYVDVRGWDPDLGTIIAQSPPTQRASIAVYDRYPVDREWVRSFGFGTFYRSALGLTAGETIAGAPPRFARYVCGQTAGPSIADGKVQLTWSIREQSTARVVAEFREAYFFCSPIPPWCYLVVVRPDDGENANALVTWTVRPIIWAEMPAAAAAAQTDIGARALRATTQTIAASTATALSFSGVTYDTDTMWSAGAPTRLTIQTAGKYSVVASVDWFGSAGQTRRLDIRLNGTTVIGQSLVQASNPDNGNHQAVEVSAEYSFIVGDYVEIIAFQDSTDPADLQQHTTSSPIAWIRKVG